LSEFCRDGFLVTQTWLFVTAKTGIQSVQQFRPVPLDVVREVWKARPMNTALQERVMKNRRIRFDEVRSDGKLLVSLLRGWAVIVP